MVILPKRLICIWGMYYFVFGSSIFVDKLSERYGTVTQQGLKTQSFGDIWRKQFPNWLPIMSIWSPLFKIRTLHYKPENYLRLRCPGAKRQTKWPLKMLPFSRVSTFYALCDRIHKRDPKYLKEWGPPWRTKWSRKRFLLWG